MNGKNVSDRRIALLSTCNLDLLVDPLTAALEEKGIRCSVWSAGFNQIRQSIMIPTSAVYAFAPNVLILWQESADLFADIMTQGVDLNQDVRRQAASTAIRELSQVVAVACASLPSATVVLNTISLQGIDSFYGLEHNTYDSFKQIVYDFNLALGELARKHPAILIFDAETLSYMVGLRQWYDSRLWYLGRIRHSAEATSCLASQLANTVAARYGQVRKCLVLDLDNTLWGGIIGEDGLADLQLGYEGIGLAFIDFQRELLNLRRKGILLAICSRNNAEDALQAFREHPAMCLREHDFAVLQINWNDKADNLRAIARQLNIGLDSLVFVDDSPVERARVRDALPEVFTPDWPQDPADYKAALLSLVSEQFLKFHITQEDVSRNSIYKAEVERRSMASTAQNLEDFYRSLEMRATIGPADHATIKRIAQLTQKTNQFNLTTRRYIESDICSFVATDCWRVYWLELTDKFGPSGIVGVLILRTRGTDVWEIDTFLLSCRVIGRTVENAFLGVICKELQRAGDKVVLKGRYIPTAKNQAVAAVYINLGFTPTSNDGEGQIFMLDLTQSSVSIPDWFEISSLIKVNTE